MHVWLPPVPAEGKWAGSIQIVRCSKCGWKWNLRAQDPHPTGDSLVHIPGTDLALTCEEAQVFDVQDG